MPLLSKILRGLPVQGSRVYYPRLKEEPSVPSAAGREDTVLPLSDAGENEQARQAAEILDGVRAEAEKLRKEILAEAAAEARRLEAKAREEGLREGFRQGETAAEEYLAEARQTLKQAQEERREILAAAEPEILQLALNIAEKILNYEISVNERCVLNIIARGLNALPAGQKVYIRVNPRDEKACRENLHELQALLREGVLLEIAADTELPQGSCRLESAEAEVEAVWQQELQILGKKLLALAVSSQESSLQKTVEVMLGET